MAGHAKAREISALREQIAKLEGKSLPAPAAENAVHADSGLREDRLRMPFGIPAWDAALEGGLPLDGITEIRTSLMGHAGAATGCLLAFLSFFKSKVTARSSNPALWISDAFSRREAGALYAPGLKQFGLPPFDILHAFPRKLEDALWLAEAAAASGALGAVILEIHGNPRDFGVTESRRLGLRVKEAMSPLFLLRHAGEEEASSASFRFLAEPAPASARRLAGGSRLGGSIGHPVFRLTLEKSRNPAALTFLLEWNPHERQFTLCSETGNAMFARHQPANPGARIPAPADRPDRAPALGHLVALEKAS